MGGRDARGRAGERGRPRAEPFRHDRSPPPRAEDEVGRKRALIMDPGGEAVSAALEPAAPTVSSDERATSRRRLTLAERAAAVICLVYPFRIFLTEFTRVDLHLGMVSFLVLGTL